MNCYLDNAATTPMDPQVIAAMHETMQSTFGNPSSSHAWGRQARGLVERSRKTIADLLNASPAEIYFTGSGTEADNLAIRSAVLGNHLKQVITSRLEHPAVLQLLKALEKAQLAQVSYVTIDDKGHIDYEHLELLLKNYGPCLVSLMHGNNEIGTLTDIVSVAELCWNYGALFHSDTVQTMGHYRFDLQQLSPHFLVGSAHKFHGPKGTGFLYARQGTAMVPVIHGGSQERNLRGGTENVCAIVGMARALELAYARMNEHQRHIQALKTEFIEQLRAAVPGIAFNGETDPDGSLYTVLNVSFPPGTSDLLLTWLDAAGIAASGGSACSSGSEERSHVLTAIGTDPQRPAVRFSFSRFTTPEEIRYTASEIRQLLS